MSNKRFIKLLALCLFIVFIILIKQKNAEDQFDEKYEYSQADEGTEKQVGRDRQVRSVAKLEREEQVEVNIFIIVCISNSTNFGEEGGRQQSQVNTLLKTLFILTSVPLNIYIFNNDDLAFSRIVRGVESWAVPTGHLLRLVNTKIHYPPGLQEMVSMFRICATARLFIDTMLPEVDSGIFLDTDIVMMDDILNLWRQLKQFSPAQVMGMAATENIYSNVDYVPYFGPPGVGLNGGVMLMNLTRMRGMSGGGFAGAVRWVFGNYKGLIKLADQDILNAIFGYSPWYLYELPCTWNYIIWQCRVDYWSQKKNPRSWLGKNQCVAAEKEGVSLIHGNSSAFYVVFEDIFKTIYEFWRDYSPAAGLLRDTGRALRERIQVLTEHSEYQLLKIFCGQVAKVAAAGLTGRNDTSPCSKVEGVADIMVSKLEHRLKKIDQT